MENNRPQTSPVMERENIMGTMEINPLLVKLSVPMMISMLVQALYNIVPFLNAVDIDPYVMYIIAGYAIVGALFGLFGGSISIGKYLNNEGENAVA